MPRGKRGSGAIHEGRVCSVCRGTRFHFAMSKNHLNGLRLRCTDCMAARAKRWAKENPEARRAIARRWNAKKSAQWKREHWLVKLDVFMNMGGECVCCGEGDIRFLTIDHLHRDGSEHRRQVGGTTLRVYEDIKKQGYPRDKFQVLCWNCHMATRFGEPCPHREEQVSAAQ